VLVGNQGRDQRSRSFDRFGVRYERRENPKNGRNLLDFCTNAAKNPKNGSNLSAACATMRPKIEVSVRRHARMSSSCLFR
jgi:hypothetical protein